MGTCCKLHLTMSSKICIDHGEDRYAGPASQRWETLLRTFCTSTLGLELAACARTPCCGVLASSLSVQVVPPNMGGASKQAQGLWLSRARLGLCFLQSPQDNPLDDVSARVPSGCKALQNVFCALEVADRLSHVNVRVPSCCQEGNPQVFPARVKNSIALK